LLIPHAYLTEQGAAVVVPQLVVKLSLSRIEIAIEGLFEFFGQLGSNLSLGTAQNEGAKGLSEQRACFRFGIVRTCTGQPEHGRRSEHSGIKKLEETPELANVVFDGGATQHQTVVCVEKASSFRRLSIGIFNHLPFIENAVVKLHILQLNGIVPQRPIGG
jgi:hypothetical protein